MAVPRQRTINVEGLAARRGTRTPIHRAQIRHKPWHLQPFMIAPVLPGETLRNLLMQARAISKPMKNTLLGAHLEHYFYYVKFRDLNDRDLITDHMINPNLTLDGAALVPQLNSAEWRLACYYNDAAECNGGPTFVPWMQLCMDRIIAEYWRAEQEDVGDPLQLVDNKPLAAIQLDDVLDSIQLEADMPAAIDIDVDANADSVITAGEINNAMRAFEMMQEMGFTEGMTYEEYLRTYGVKTNPEELHRPEEIRYSKAWSYPGAMFEPSTGVPSSAFNWKVALRADKHRFFKEHGFLVGVSCMRPKVYLGSVLQSAVGLLRNTRQWLPALLRNDTATSLLRIKDPSQYLNEFVAPTVNCTTPDNVPVWLDVADLYRYGDQFVNFALTETNAGFVALPDATLNKRYVTSADINGLFTGANDAARVVEQDIAVAMTIATASASRDATTTTVPAVLQP